MKKQEVQSRVLQNGKPLDLDKFNWDENSKTFSTVENNLVIDFAGISGCTFKTGSFCTFKTGIDCTFDTVSHCTFKTGSNCTFKTNYNCTFKTSYNCTFKTGTYCTFKTSYGCTFNTGYGCTFDTDYACTFKTGTDCTFNTGYGCTFKTGSSCTFNTSRDCTFDTIKENCVIVRHDVFEFYQLPVGKSIKLNGYGIKGYKEINVEPNIEVTVKINGKEAKLSDLSDETLLKIKSL